MVILTESCNLDTKNIDRVSTFEMVKMINEEDKKVAVAIEKELDHIAQAIDLIVEQVSN
jgi:N-acetylmuramic acid 6-phosphate etherase